MNGDSPKAMMMTTAFSGLVAWSQNPALQQNAEGLVHAAAIGLGATFLSQSLMAYAKVNFAQPFMNVAMSYQKPPQSNLFYAWAICVAGMVGGAVIGHKVTEAEVLKNLRLNEKTITPAAKPAKLGYHNTSLFSLT